MSEAWRRLRQYELRDYLAMEVRSRHGKTATAWRIEDLAARFTQGRQMFASSERADRSVRPILLYYGVQSLSKALILLLDWSLTAHSLRPAHGLATRDWAHVLAHKSAAPLSRLHELGVSLTGGTFLELLRATENRAYFRVGSNGVRWQYAYSQPVKGSSLGFREVVRSLPDLELEYRSWTGETPLVVELQEYSESESSAHAKLARAISQDEAARLFQVRGGFTLGSGDGTASASVTCETANGLQFAQRSSSGLGGASGPGSLFGIANVVVAEPFDTVDGLSTLGKLFVCAYVLASLARYHPAIWIRVGHMHRGDSALGVFERITDVVQDQYPKYVAQFLEQAASGHDAPR